MQVGSSVSVVVPRIVRIKLEKASFLYWQADNAIKYLEEIKACIQKFVTGSIGLDEQCFAKYRLR